MADAARFLVAMGQSLATMTLYHEGHPARERVVDAAYQALGDLQGSHPRQVFTFMGTDVLHGGVTLRELRGWEWSERFTAHGIQRIEIDGGLSREEFEELLADLLGRITGWTLGQPSPEERAMRPSRARVGGVGLAGASLEPSQETAAASLDYSLQEEMQAVDWMQSEVADHRRLPLLEAEAVVRSLTVAMHGDSRMVLPLLKVRSHDEYTTTHSMNVAVLSMALAEFMGLSPTEVRAYGVAGLLHDIGKVRIPRDILNKPGVLTPAEREQINRHPEEGAKILLETERNMELAAVVAYEHHLLHAGGGYPALRYCRTCHAASRLAHVCDVYDALRTHRPYRPAWTSPEVLSYIEQQAGTELDPDAAHAFVRMMHTWDVRLAADAGARTHTPDRPSAEPAGPSASESAV
jgi:putative nucleotidyltransferase with HDIG domain